MDEQGSILDRIISQQRTSELTSFRPFELKKQLFSLLKSREEEVLTKRFGLSGRPKMTLEEIGKEYHVTRERIRQVEILAIKKLLKAITENNGFASSIRIVHYLLEQTGGVREEQELLDEVSELFTEEKNEGGEDVYTKAAAKNFFLFCLNHLWGGEVVKIEESADFRKGWRLPGASLEVLKTLFREAEQLIEKKGAPIEETELINSLRGSAFWKEFEAKHQNQAPKTDEGTLGALTLSKRINSNVFGEWGIASWPLIHPKRMTDKIYLVLKHRGKPMHFREITETINTTKFDSKKAYTPTIHNELILDKRYVLIGRGIYALSEWGYHPGTVSDVIVGVLKSAGGPLSRRDIVTQVLKQRMVHEATINLALTNKKLFSREGSLYVLTKES